MGKAKMSASEVNVPIRGLAGDFHRSLENLAFPFSIKPNHPQGWEGEPLAWRRNDSELSRLGMIDALESGVAKADCDPAFTVHKTRWQTAAYSYEKGDPIQT
jgi:hypothetical protein